MELVGRNPTQRAESADGVKNSAPEPVRFGVGFAMEQWKGPKR
jgi:hypothetical protein